MVINDDFKPNYTLKAANFSEAELMDQIEKQYNAERDPNWDDEFEESACTWVDTVKNSNYVKNDIDFSTENIDYEDDEELQSILGLTTLSNGVPIYGCVVAGDWELPLYICFYSDGKHVNMYVPRRGNTVNLDAMSAFGSDGDEDVSAAYLKKYGVESGEETYDCAAITKELEQVLVPTSNKIDNMDMLVNYVLQILDEGGKSKNVGDCINSLLHILDAIEEVKNFRTKTSNPEEITKCTDLLKVLELFTEKLYIVVSKNVGTYSKAEDIYGKIKKALV